jgi:hypothetical protein
VIPRTCAVAEGCAGHFENLRNYGHIQVTESGGARMPGPGRLQQAAAASAAKKQVDLDVQAYQKARNTFVNAVKVRYVAFRCTQGV